MSVRGTRAPADRLRAWSYRRLLLEKPAGSPLQALRDVVAVYSAHPSAPLSLLSRSTPFTAKELGDLERDRAALRVLGMRGSAFLAPAETAGRIFTTTRFPPTQLTSKLRALGLDVETYEALKPRILEAAREPIAPRHLKAALGAGDEAVYAMRIMAREGLVLRVGWHDHVRSDSLRWVAAEAWLGRPLAAADDDRDEARRWLSGAYLHAFGPARIEDVAWWIGISQRAARDAVAGLELADLGDGLLLPAELANAFAATEPLDPDAVAVLPKWDPYTMGYAPDGRQRLVDDAHLPLAYSGAGTAVGATTGDGRPLVVRGGRAVAAWQHRLAERRMEITVQPFGESMIPHADGLDAAFSPVGELLGAQPVVTVEVPDER